MIQPSDKVEGKIFTLWPDGTMTQDGRPAGRHIDLSQTVFTFRGQAVPGNRLAELLGMAGPQGERAPTPQKS